MTTATKSSTNKLIRKGLETKAGILDTSVDIASAEGLEGLTIGRLAKDLKMSKSGLFAHFGSKEDLQMETVRRARDVFIEAIVLPAADQKAGLVKLKAMLENWIVYVETSVFRGGCFFFAVSAEMDDRPGRVKELIAHLTMSWVKVIEEELRIAVANGELSSNLNINRTAFQLHGTVQEANWFFRLHGRADAFDMARESISEILATQRK